MDPSLFGRCCLCFTISSRCELLWLLVGFVPQGHSCLQNPPLLLFINIRAKYSLFKLLVPVQILISGFMFRIRRVGWWGHAWPGWEFSIFGSQAVWCLAKTWFEGKREKNKSSSSLSEMVTPAPVCARAPGSKAAGIHPAQASRAGENGHLPQEGWEREGGIGSAGLAGGLGR